MEIDGVVRRLRRKGPPTWACPFAMQLADVTTYIVYCVSVHTIRTSWIIMPAIAPGAWLVGWYNTDASNGD